MQVKNTSISIHDRKDIKDMVVLDLDKLGNPYYRLPKLIEESMQAWENEIFLYFVNNYQVPVNMLKSKVNRNLNDSKCIVFNTEQGSKIGFSIDRKFLLYLLNRYYGIQGDSELLNDMDCNVTATEKRLRKSLGENIIKIFFNLDIFNKKINLEIEKNLFDEWIYEYTCEISSPGDYKFSILLSKNAIEELLLKDDSENKKVRRRGIDPNIFKEITKNSKVKLRTIVMSCEMNLGDLKHIQPEDVILADLHNPAFVLNKNNVLLKANIVEDMGKLFLCNPHEA